MELQDCTGNAFETVTFGTAPVLVFCDHASNRVPDCVSGGSLGLADADMERHIAFDIGARAVSLLLARALDCRAILSRFSRLVIDPNRGEDDPTLIMQLYDGSLIPANRRIDRAERERRLDTFHRPYHRAAAGMMDAMLRDGTEPVLVSIHSFTPQLRGRPPRPWHVGLLYAEDARIATPLLAHLARDPALCIGDNLPYHGKLEGDCMHKHGILRALPHILIEFRNDLIADAQGQRAWTDRVLPALQRTIDDYRMKETNAHG